MTLMSGRGREAGAGAASHDWRKMSSYGNNHWVIQVIIHQQLITNNVTRLGKCCLVGPLKSQILNKVSKIKLEHKIVPNYVFWAPYLVDAGALIIITLKKPFLKLNIFRVNSHSPLQLSFNNWLIIFLTPQQWCNDCRLRVHLSDTCLPLPPPPQS